MRYTATWRFFVRNILSFNFLFLFAKIYLPTCLYIICCHIFWQPASYLLYSLFLKWTWFWFIGLASHKFVWLLIGCGMKLRGDDPSEMKTLISSVQSRANYLKASSEKGQSNLSSIRVYMVSLFSESYLLQTSIDDHHFLQMKFMLETIYDIKNNRKRSEEDTLKFTQVKKWLQKVSTGLCFPSCLILSVTYFRMTFYMSGWAVIRLKTLPILFWFISY